VKNLTNQHVLDDDRIGRLLLKLSMPAFFGMAVMTLYNVVDTIFIGHYVGAQGIAGLSIVFPFQMLAMGIGHMTGMGGASLISRLIGSKNIAKAEHTLGNAITSTLIFSSVLMIIGLINPDFWLNLMGSSETILPYARDYMTIILAGNVIQTSAMTLNTIVTAEGNARTAMRAMIAGAVLNIILDALFIIPLNLGIKGAAYATVIAQSVSVAYILSFYLRRKSFLKLAIRNMAIDWSILGAILSIGIAAFARTMAVSFAGILVNTSLVSYGGDLAVSAYGIINRIMMFAIMPGIVIGQGLQPILGYNYGARRYDRAYRAIKTAIAAATFCCLIVFILLYFLPEPFIRIFTSDQHLIDSGVHAAKRIFLTLYLVGFIMVGSLVFQSIGKAKLSFLTAVARPALFLIPMLFILPNYFHLDGIWLAFPIADVLSFVLTLVLMIPQIMEFKNNRHI
jgi:putative MATE family efflux protein